MELPGGLNVFLFSKKFNVFENKNVIKSGVLNTIVIQTYLELSGPQITIEYILGTGFLSKVGVIWKTQVFHMRFNENRIEDTGLEDICGFSQNS